MIRAACLLVALTPALAFAEQPRPPKPRPQIANHPAPHASPHPHERFSGQLTDRMAQPAAPHDYQAMLDAAAVSPDARVLLRDLETGEIIELWISQFLAIGPGDIPEDRYELKLIDPGANVATNLPFAEVQTFAAAHPEYGHTASIDPGAGWMPVGRAFFDPASTSPPAAYHVILVAGPDLAGDPRIVSVGEALCDQPSYSDIAHLDPSGIAVVAAPIGRTPEEGEKVRLSADYDFSRAARWLDTLSGAALGREASARLDRRAFGFIAAPQDPVPALDGADPSVFNGVDAIYIDLSAISPGYVEELVTRIVRGMHEGDAVSHTGAVTVLEAFSLVERIGAATLQIAALLEPSAASAATEEGGC